MAQVIVTEEEKRKIHEDVAKLRQDVLAQHMKPYQNPTPEQIIVVYCTTFYDENVRQAAKNLTRIAPHVDRCVLVHDGTPQPSDIDKLYKITSRKAEFFKAEFLYRRWEDHFSKQRNAYLDHIKEGEWVLASDPDEVFNLEFLKKLRVILTEAEKQGLNILGINSTNIITDLDGKVTRTASDQYKQLIFKFEEGVRYVGHINETLLPGIHGWRGTILDPHYYYNHFHTTLEIKEHAARNVFIGGGGTNALTKNPMYTAWREIAENLKVANWPQMRDYIRRGNINPGLKQLFIDHRNDCGWQYEDESRLPFLWYKTLFPQEMTEWESTPNPPSAGSPPEVMAYVEEQYQKILERPADKTGKEAYTDAILRGVINREDLPTHLMNSAEYKQKHQKAKQVE
jgi:hypothetical protein